MEPAHLLTGFAKAECVHVLMFDFDSCKSLETASRQDGCWNTSQIDSSLGKAPARSPTFEWSSRCPTRSTTCFSCARPAQPAASWLKPSSTKLGKATFVASARERQPAGQVNPVALELLRRNRIGTDGLSQQDWNEFAEPNAPHLDFVFTVCDKAAGEVCPCGRASR